MKFCSIYSKDIKNISKMDEVIIEYKNNKVNIINFFETTKFNRVIISIEEDIDDVDFFIELQKKYNETPITLRFNHYYYLLNPTLKKLAAAGIRYFFNTRVTDFDILNGLIKLGVSDVYIVEDLGFDLNRVHMITSPNQVQIRVFPNIAQSSWYYIDDLKKFFIRPEDTDFYGQYVDVFEFFGDKEYTDLYYDIYSNKKEWFGDLKEIIIDFNKTLDSRCIVDFFADKRIKCQKKCLKGFDCRICDRIEDLAKTFHNNEIIVEHTNEPLDN